MTDPPTPNEHDQPRARALRPSQKKSDTDTPPHSGRVEIDPADRYLALLGFFSGEEFMEEASDRPF
jgi:hypothetical protein